MYTPEELEQLDAAGLPEPKTEKQLDAIVKLFHAVVHEHDVVCCVCDQFMRISESVLVPSSCLPSEHTERDFEGKLLLSFFT